MVERETGQSDEPSRVTAPAPRDQQEALFADPSIPDEEVGFRGPVASAAAGITYRQLDYWTRTELIKPSVRSAHGSGSQRLYSFRDVLVMKVIKRLLDAGVSLQQIRKAVERLPEMGAADLASLTIMSDGASVYDCTSEDEVVDLVRGGQGVFGIAVGQVWREVEADLVSLPNERADGQHAEAAEGDELARRRQRRASGD